MRINKTLAAADTTGYVVDLRRTGDTTSPYNQVGSVQVTSQKTGMAAAECWVQFISLGPNDPIPSAPSNPAPGAGLTADWIHLKSDGKTSTLWGSPFGPGYNPAAQGIIPPATHVLVYSVAAGDVVVEAR